MNLIKELMEGFTIVQGLQTLEFSLSRQIDLIEKEKQLSYQLKDINGVSCILSSRNILGKVYVFILGEGKMVCKNNRFMDVLPENTTIVGNITLEHSKVLYQPGSHGVRELKLKQEIITPHVFLQDNYRGKQIPERIYKHFLQTHDFVSSRQTNGASKLWEKLGKVHYFKFPTRGNTPDTCEKDDSGVVWKKLEKQNAID